MMRTRTLAILIFDDVDVLDFCGPFEVFSVANRFTDPPAFNVLSVAEKTGPVVTRGGLSVNPHHRLNDCPQPDLLLVPGGQGTRKEMHNPALIDSHESHHSTKSCCRPRRHRQRCPWAGEFKVRLAKPEASR
jgi:transcriptional regulator GlxA family with amidase domain